MDDGLMRFPTSISAACAWEEEGCRSSFRRRGLKVSDSLTSPAHGSALSPKREQ